MQGSIRGQALIRTASIVLLFLMCQLLSLPAAAQCAAPNTPAQIALCQAAAADPGGVGAIVNTYSVSNVGVQQLSTQSDIQLNTAVIASPASQRTQIACVTARRQGRQGAGCSPAAQSSETKKAVQPGFSPQAISVLASWSQLEQDTDKGQSGFDGEAPGVLVTLDSRVMPAVSLSMGLGLQRSRLDMAFEGIDSGHVDSDTIRALAQASWAFSDSAYAEAGLGYGRTRYQSERQCTVCVVLNSANRARFSGDEFAISAGLGNTYKLAGFQIGAHARLDYLRFETQGYTESGASDGNVQTALQVDGQSSDSFTSTLGAQAGYVLDRQGLRLTPRARLEWVHEYANNPRTISSRFVTASAVSIQLVTADPVRDWVNVGVGLDVANGKAWSLHFDYGHLFKRDLNGDLISAKWRYSF